MLLAAIKVTLILFAAGQTGAFGAGPAPPTVKAPATDVQGDPLPPGAALRLGTVRLRHANTVTSSIVFAPDGKTVALGRLRRDDSALGGDHGQAAAVVGGPASVWRPGRGLRAGRHDPGFGGTAKPSACGKQAPASSSARSPGHQGGIGAVAFAPDGKTLVSASFDNTLRLWDTATGKEVRVLGRTPFCPRHGLFSRRQRPSPRAAPTAWSGSGTCDTAKENPRFDRAPGCRPCGRVCARRQAPGLGQFRQDGPAGGIRSPAGRYPPHAFFDAGASQRLSYPASRCFLPGRLHSRS